MSAVMQINPLADHAQRYNLYSSIHKALRGFMIDTLARVGKTDVEDDCEFEQVIQQAHGLLRACRSHLKHENDFVHPALERALSGSSKLTSDDHVQHIQAIDALEFEVTRLETVHVSQRAFLTQLLYLQLSGFVAENFEHMLVEETDNHLVLIAAYTDEELLQIKDAIVAAIPPQENMMWMKWMLEYMNNAERTAVLRGMKEHAPPPVFQAAVELARNTLSQRDFFKLERALSWAQLP